MMRYRIVRICACAAAVASLALAPAGARAQEGAGGPGAAQKAVGELLGEASKLEAEGKFDEAIAVAERAAAAAERDLAPGGPYSFMALWTLGRLHDRKADLDAAERFYARAIELGEKSFGPDDKFVGTLLASLASVHDRRGDLARAEPLYLRALAIGEKAEPNVGLVTVYSSLGSLYRRRGDPARAESFYLRAIETGEKVLGPRNEFTAGTRVSLALMYERVGSPARGIPLLERALADREAAHGPESVELSATLALLGRFYRHTDDYARAERTYLRALAIAEKAHGPDHAEVAIPLDGLGAVYMARDELSRAEEPFSRALAVREKALGPGHWLVALSLNSLARLDQLRGAYAPAEERYLRAVAVLEKATEPNPDELATVLANLGSLYSATGDYARAEAHYKRALEIDEAVLGPEHPDVAIALNGLGSLYYDRGDYDRAETAFRRALEIREKSLGPENASVAASLNNLGLVHGARKDYARAEALYRRSLAVAEKALGPDDGLVASALNNLATLFWERGRPAPAEPLLRRALAIYEKIHGAEHPDVALALNNLGTLREALGRAQDARRLYLRADAIAGRTLGPEHPNRAAFLTNLATVEARVGRMPQALEALALANDIRERNIALVLALGSEQQKRLYMATIAGETDGTVSMHARSAPASPRALELALTTVLRRKGRALDVMSDQIAALRRRLDPEDRELLDRLSGAKARLATLTLEGPGAGDPGAHRAEVERLAAEVERLESDASARSAELREQARPVTLDLVRRAVPPGAALVEIVAYRPYDPRARARGARFGGARYVAYVVRSDEEPAWVDLGPVAPIDAGIARLRRALANPESADAKPAARALDERVMRPVRRLLGGARTLVLSPDGSLNLVPFGALVSERGRFLVEDFSISYVTSGRDLLRLGAGSERRQGSVVVANPDFDLSGAAAGPGARARRSADVESVTFTRLPGTADEARALAGLLPDASQFDGARATEQTIKSLRGPYVLHVATHGFFLADREAAPFEGTRGLQLGAAGEGPSAVPGENPLLRSGLALAGANRRAGGGDDDGILTALEAAALDLRGTRLVVLSACETGVGETKNGDGVYGLRRALVLAGAESQVASLWRVSDAATRDLMVAYYSRLRDGGGRAEALRRVQLEMLADPRRRHPFYWASFIPIGDWRPLDGGPAR